jgi:drug/metabolite transporter (DMT)-like permease
LSAAADPGEEKFKIGNFMYFALGSAFSNVIATIVNKHLLSREKMHVLSFSIWLFIFLCLTTAIALPWLGTVNWELFWRWEFVLSFCVMITLAAIWNYFYYSCLQKESLTDFQLISITQPLFTIFLSLLLIPEERNYKIIIATIVAGLALFFSHVHRWKIDNFVITVPLFLSIILASIESLFIKQLLVVFSPVSLYFVRTAFVAIIFYFSFPNKLKLASAKNIWQTWIIAFFAIITMILSYYSYEYLGIAKTSLVGLLYPVLTTIISVYLLKERVKKRKLFAFAVIICCLIYVFL